MHMHIHTYAYIIAIPSADPSLLNTVTVVLADTGRLRTSAGCTDPSSSVTL